MKRIVDTDLHVYANESTKQQVEDQFKTLLSNCSLNNDEVYLIKLKFDKDISFPAIASYCNQLRQRLCDCGCGDSFLIVPLTSTMKDVTISKIIVEDITNVEEKSGQDKKKTT